MVIPKVTNRKPAFGVPSPFIFIIFSMRNPENKNAYFAGDRIQDANSKFIVHKSSYVTTNLCNYPAGELINSPPTRSQALKDP